jgi:hypothetical protein
LCVVGQSFVYKVKDWFYRFLGSGVLGYCLTLASFAYDLRSAVSCGYFMDFITSGITIKVAI